MLTTLSPIEAELIDDSQIELPTGIKPTPGRKLTPSQSKLTAEVLQWLKAPHSTTMCRRVEGAAGVGKTFVMASVLDAARHYGLLGGEIIGCAPTHPAKNVLRNSLGDRADKYCTIDSLLNLRPQKAKFTPVDQRRLNELLGMAERTIEQDAMIDQLQEKQLAASKGSKADKVFVSSKAPDFTGVRLIIVDEAGMLGDYRVGLLYEALSHAPWGLQVLFLGDAAQLTPIKNKRTTTPNTPELERIHRLGLSRVFEIPAFSPLTEVVRYSGAIREYVEQVRPYALGEIPGDGFLRLHRSIVPAPGDESFLRLAPYHVFDRDALQEVATDHTFRIVSRTNARVDELNNLCCLLLKDGRTNPHPIGPRTGTFYEAGDLVLTTSPVSRALSEVYGLGHHEDGCNQISTSTVIKLTRPVEIGDVISVDAGSDKVYCQAGNATISEDMFSYRSSMGTTFHRTLFYYSIDGDADYHGNVIALLDPDERIKYQSELESLRLQAMSTVSRGKTKEAARGQNGDYAKAVWERYGLKTWFKKLDKSPLDIEEYTQIKRQLWADYFALRNFVDSASFAWASTCHRAQGSTVDIVVMDMGNLTEGQSWRVQDELSLIEAARLLYTAATRAKVQLIILE